MDNAEKLLMFSESIDASQLVLCDYLVTLIDREDGMRPATGILLKVSSHLFIMTARHVVPANPTRRLWPAVREWKDVRDGLPVFSAVHKSDTLDVAVLEVHPEGALRYFGDRRFCTLENISTFGSGRSNQGHIVTGAPAELVRLTPSEDYWEYGAGLLMYWTLPIPPEEWPTVRPDATPPMPDVDIFLNYPSNEQCESDGVAPLGLPDPHGLSGGGIWDQDFASGEMWSPAALKLIGIQCSWDSRGRYLRGIQIIHWLRLIHHHYSDLRNELDARFELN